MISKPHKYEYRAIRADGSRYSEIKQILPEQVATMTGRSGNRADFLELVNRWNNQGSARNLSGLISIYIALTE